jgi:nucleoside-diphosphate-sugar epimerase
MRGRGRKDPSPRLARKAILGHCGEHVICNLRRQADMAHSRVTVFGGSGFLGRQIVKRLADDGADVRVAVRRPERAAFLTEVRRAGQIAPVYADVWDEATVAPVVDGSDAVINTVGHYVERGNATFEAIHGQGALHVARASAMAGVRRLVHISGLGADPTSDSAYVRARGMAKTWSKKLSPAPPSSARALSLARRTPSSTAWPPWRA